MQKEILKEILKEDENGMIKVEKKELEELKSKQAFNEVLKTLNMVVEKALLSFEKPQPQNEYYKSLMFLNELLSSAVNFETICEMVREGKLEIVDNIIKRR